MTTVRDVHRNYKSGGCVAEQYLIVTCASGAIFNCDMRISFCIYLFFFYHEHQLLLVRAFFVHLKESSFFGSSYNAKISVGFLVSK